MRSVSDALATILQEVRPAPPGQVPLSDALGLVLAEDVISDADSPPFDKALMDGFAIRSIDLGGKSSQLQVIEEVTAGRVPSRAVGPSEAIRIMTGAPIPNGADAVVRVEDTQFDLQTKTVTISGPILSSGANLMLRGTSIKQGDCVVPGGGILRPQEMGALAEMGQSRVLVRKRPRIAVLATGDELVPVSETPGPGKIRNSNETMLVAQIQRAGGEAVPLGIARDERLHLGEKIREGLGWDMLLLSGGVSAGKLDLVPSELEAAGVRQVFHKVQLKPGKPIWFGVYDLPRSDEAHGTQSQCFVFGLPGNPVSSMVCFELFVRTAIRRLMGIEPAEPQAVKAVLQSEYESRGNRPVYFPCHLNWEQNGPVVRLVNWQGSADLRATVDANAMAVFPAGDKIYKPGDCVDVICW